MGFPSNYAYLDWIAAAWRKDGADARVRIVAGSTVALVVPIFHNAKIVMTPIVSASSETLFWDEEAGYDALMDHEDSLSKASTWVWRYPRVPSVFHARALSKMGFTGAKKFVQDLNDGGLPVQVFERQHKGGERGDLEKLVQCSRSSWLRITKASMTTFRISAEDVERMHKEKGRETAWFYDLDTEKLSQCSEGDVDSCLLVYSDETGDNVVPIHTHPDLSTMRRAWIWYDDANSVCIRSETPSDGDLVGILARNMLGSYRHILVELVIAPEGVYSICPSVAAQKCAAQDETNIFRQLNRIIEDLGNMRKVVIDALHILLESAPLLACAESASVTSSSLTEFGGERFVDEDIALKDFRRNMRPAIQALPEDKPYSDEQAELLFESYLRVLPLVSVMMTTITTITGNIVADVIRKLITDKDVQGLYDMHVAERTITYMRCVGDERLFALALHRYQGIERKGYAEISYFKYVEDEPVRSCLIM